MSGQNDVHVPACRYLSNSDFCPLEFSPNLRIEDKALLKHDQHSPRCFSLHSCNEDQSFKVGYPNVGKSSLFNAFVGRIHRKLTKESIFFEEVWSDAFMRRGWDIHTGPTSVSVLHFCAKLPVCGSYFPDVLHTCADRRIHSCSCGELSVLHNRAKCCQGRHETALDIRNWPAVWMVKVTPLSLLCYMPLYSDMPLNNNRNGTCATPQAIPNAIVVRKVLLRRSEELQ